MPKPFAALQYKNFDGKEVTAKINEPASFYLQLKKRTISYPVIT
jgi:hypothetical protein